MFNFIDRFKEYKDNVSIIWNDSMFTYVTLSNRIEKAIQFLRHNAINSGDVVALTGDFTPNTLAFLFALLENKNIIVPLSFNSIEKDQIKQEVANVQTEIIINPLTDEFYLQNQNLNGKHELYDIIRERKSPGLVLFTSGTSGKPKGAVHDLEKLLKKFHNKRKAMSTINFLLFDHWGGLNTMFHTLSNGGIVLSLRDRKPSTICELIEKHQIELLPASPTFLNLLLISEEYKKFDLSSLKLITYGSEPMPLSTLDRLRNTFPHVGLQQTYGLIELGVLRSKSKDDNSLWVKIGGEGYETRVVNNLLEIKADSAMLGYLNATSPFTDDGWFMTGDEVEVDGEYIKILGRKSEIINVGGEKVYPTEVENVIHGIKNIAEVRIYGEKNSIMGNIICAQIRLIEPEVKSEFITRLKIYCRSKLEPFKIPVRIFIDENDQFNDRFKKKRF